MPRLFRGVIKLDTRESKADWDAFLENKSPKDAPNVLVILTTTVAPRGLRYVDAESKAEGAFRTMTGRFSLCGEGQRHLLVAAARSSTSRRPTHQPPDRP